MFSELVERVVVEPEMKVLRCVACSVPASHLVMLLSFRCNVISWCSGLRALLGTAEILFLVMDSVWSCAGRETAGQYQLYFMSRTHHLIH